MRARVSSRGFIQDGCSSGNCREHFLQPVAESPAKNLLAQSPGQDALRDIAHFCQLRRLGPSQPFDRFDRATHVAVTDRDAEIVLFQKIGDVRRLRTEIEHRAPDGHGGPPHDRLHPRSRALWRWAARR